MGFQPKDPGPGWPSYAWLFCQHFSAEPRLVALSGVGLFEGWRPILFNVEWQQVAAQASTADATALSWQTFAQDLTQNA